MRTFGNKPLSLFLFLILQVQLLRAQLPPLPINQPEQNACGAIVVCADSFVAPRNYIGRGTKDDITTNACSGPLLPAESHSMWLKLKIASSGSLIFTIRPIMRYDDFDFAVYDITGKPCDSVNAMDLIRCNYNTDSFSYMGWTGLTMASPNIIVPEGAVGAQSCKFIDADSGKVYLIQINGDAEFINLILHNPAAYGFTIDFTGSTARFEKGNPPMMDSVEQRCNINSSAIVRLSRTVKCSSIAPDGSDFEMQPNNLIYAVAGVGCNLSDQSYTDKVKVSFTTFIPPGNYTLHARNGSDGNTLIDLCDEPMPLPNQASFWVSDLTPHINVIVCTEQMPYTWNGIPITAPGQNITTFTTMSAAGCDSSTTISLAVVDTIKNTVDLPLCTSKLPFSWNGLTINVLGSNAAVFHTPASGGCDSMVTLNLIPILPSSLTTQVSGCGSVIFDGQTYTTNQAVLDTLFSAYGCDSIYRTINISVHPVITPVTISSDTAGCGFLLFMDKVYTANTVVTDTLLNQHGCDSVYHHYRITVYPNVQPMKVTIQSGGCDTVHFEGVTYDRDTTLVTVFANRIGCDSVVRFVEINIRNLELNLVASPEQPVKGDYLSLYTSSNIPGYSITSWSPPAWFPLQQAREQHFILKQSDTFTITGVSPEGCTDTFKLFIKADSLIPELIMPNAFSPNDDGLNDVFGPNFVNKSGYVVKTFRIFNRWGNLVYQSFNSRKDTWDGSNGNEGKPENPGTYYYQIEIEFINGKKTILKGEVILIR